MISESQHWTTVLMLSGKPVQIKLVSILSGEITTDQCERLQRNVRVAKIQNCGTARLLGSRGGQYHKKVQDLLVALFVL